MAAKGLTWKDLFDSEYNNNVIPLGRETSRYIYRDADGSARYAKIRFEPKTFRIDPVGARRDIPYNLPALQAAPGGTIYLVEGEKAADALSALGALATTSGGTTSWRPEMARYFANPARNVVILPDNDEPGRKYASEVSAAMLQAGANVKIVNLPNLPDKGDVVDWLEMGGTLEQLDEMSRSARERPKWEPEFTKDALARPVQEMKWLVDGLLPFAGFSVLAAKPKVGKSTLAFQLAYSIARGHGFLGRSTRKGPVLYVAIEGNRDAITEQMRSIGASSEPVAFMYGQAPQDPLQAVQPYVEKIKPVLIIIDTMFKFARVENINDYAAVIAALDPLMEFARINDAHVLGTVHAKKESVGVEDIDSILGSAAIPGQVDTMLFMKRTPEGPRIFSTVQRYGHDVPPTIIQFDYATQESALGVEPRVAAMESFKAQILDFMRESGEWLTKDDVLAAVTGRHQDTLQAFRELANLAGTPIERKGLGVVGDPILYHYMLGVPGVPGGNDDKSALLLGVPGVPLRERKEPEEPSVGPEDRRPSVGMDGGIPENPIALPIANSESKIRAWTEAERRKHVKGEE